MTNKTKLLRNLKVKFFVLLCCLYISPAYSASSSNIDPSCKQPILNDYLFALESIATNSIPNIGKMGLATEQKFGFTKYDSSLSKDIYSSFFNSKKELQPGMLGVDFSNCLKTAEFLPEQVNKAKDKIMENDFELLDKMKDISHNPSLNSYEKSIALEKLIEKSNPEKKFKASLKLDKHKGAKLCIIEEDFAGRQSRPEHCSPPSLDAKTADRYRDLFAINSGFDFNIRSLDTYKTGNEGDPRILNLFEKRLNDICPRSQEAVSKAKKAGNKRLVEAIKSNETCNQIHAQRQLNKDKYSSKSR